MASVCYMFSLKNVKNLCLKTIDRNSQNCYYFR